MAEEKEKKKVEVFETRQFKYANEVEFEFSVDVSKPELAVAEITDFLELVTLAVKDLGKLREEFVKMIEKPKAKEAPKEEKKKT